MFVVYICASAQKQTHPIPPVHPLSWGRSSLMFIFSSPCTYPLSLQKYSCCKVNLALSPWLPIMFDSHHVWHKQPIAFACLYLIWHIEEACCFAAFVIAVFRSSYVRKGLYNCAEKIISKKLNGPSDTLLRKWRHSGTPEGQSRFVVSVKFM